MGNVNHATSLWLKENHTCTLGSANTLFLQPQLGQQGSVGQKVGLGCGEQLHSGLVVPRTVYI